MQEAEGNYESRRRERKVDQADWRGILNEFRNAVREDLTHARDVTDKNPS